MKIPRSLPSRQARQLLKYCFWLVLALIAGMFALTLQDREYPLIFENMAWLIVGNITGALKLQENSNS